MVMHFRGNHFTSLSNQPTAIVFDKKFVVSIHNFGKLKSIIGFSSYIFYQEWEWKDVLQRRKMVTRWKWEAKIVWNMWDGRKNGISKHKICLHKCLENISLFSRFATMYPRIRIPMQYSTSKTEFPRFVRLLIHTTFYVRRHRWISMFNVRLLNFTLNNRRKLRSNKSFFIYIAYRIPFYIVSVARFLPSFSLCLFILALHLFKFWSHFKFPNFIKSFYK